MCAFKSIRDHSHLPFADSFTQDMDFWRQRCERESVRIATPSSFAVDRLQSLPRNPFRDSGGMLFGQGVSPRRDVTKLGALMPDLASYRYAVGKVGHIQRFPLTPQGLTSIPSGDLSLSPEARAARGMAALQPLTPPPMSRLQKKYETGLLIEAPNQAISASLRRVMPRSRLDARMYAASPG